jgi:lipid-binding SYLF domain-containing protein
MRRFSLTLVLVPLSALALWAVDNTKVLDAATQTVQSMTTGATAIPSSLLRDTKCIAVIPKLTKAGFIVGGEHGNGVVSCRTESGWSAPAFITITGGSVGLQAGGEHQEIVLLMNNQGKQELINGHWDLGAEAVAAGPTGDSAGVAQSTGWKAPVLSYAHSSGAYAGANLQGSKIDLDQDANHNLYGSSTSIQSILDGQAPAPETVQQFLSALEHATGK